MGVRNKNVRIACAGALRQFDDLLLTSGCDRESERELSLKERTAVDTTLSAEVVVATLGMLQVADADFQSDSHSCMCRQDDPEVCLFPLDCWLCPVPISTTI
jgi:hypothetical protein